MWWKHSLKVGPFAVASLLVLGSCVGSSGASSAPRLTPHRYYAASTSHFRLGFIAHSPTVITEATAGLGGSQYLEGTILTNCPAVSSKALTSPGYPQIGLKLVHGYYAFSLNYNVTSVESGYPGQSSRTLPSVRVRLTGRVESTSVVVGTLQLTGAPCTTPTYAYTAKIDPADTSSLAPNA
jgi:hypothetical protein